MKKITIKSLVLAVAAALVMMTAAMAYAGWFQIESERSSSWRAVRDAYFKQHRSCAACGRPAEQVHHVLPFHLFPALELDPDNLISLCARDHLLFGHLDNTRSYNRHVREDCAAMLDRIMTRPMPSKLKVHLPAEEPVFIPVPAQ